MLQEDWTGICQSQSRLMSCYRLIRAPRNKTVVLYKSSSASFYGSCCLGQYLLRQTAASLVAFALPRSGNTCSLVSQLGQPRWRILWLALRFLPPPSPPRSSQHTCLLAHSLTLERIDRLSHRPVEGFCECPLDSSSPFSSEHNAPNRTSSHSSSSRGWSNERASGGDNIHPGRVQQSCSV